MTDPNDFINDSENGLSISEYFAAKAMQGFCANPEVTKYASRVANGLEQDFESIIAVMAKAMADALIAQLNIP